MDEREQQRKVRHRLGVLRHAEEVSGNVSATCRYYGISRQCFYKWKRRYDELGEQGLRDGSSRPHHSPNATDPEIIAKVIYLRRSDHFGSGKKSEDHLGDSHPLTGDECRTVVHHRPRTWEGS